MSKSDCVSAARFAQIFKSNVNISKIKDKEYKIFFNNSSAITLYQIWVANTPELNNERLTYNSNTGTWVDIFNKNKAEPTTLMSVGNKKYAFVLQKVEYTKCKMTWFISTTEIINLSKTVSTNIPIGVTKNAKLNVNNLSLVKNPCPLPDNQNYFNQILNGDVTITSIGEKIYKIVFNKADIVTLYQIRSVVDTKRRVFNLSPKNWVKFVNQTNFYQPTTIMELGNKCKYAFIVAKIEYTDKMIWYISTIEILNFSTTITNGVKIGTFKNVRFDVDGSGNPNYNEFIYALSNSGTAYSNIYNAFTLEFILMSEIPGYNLSYIFNAIKNSDNTICFSGLNAGYSAVQILNSGGFSTFSYPFGLNNYTIAGTVKNNSGGLVSISSFKIPGNISYSSNGISWTTVSSPNPNLQITSLCNANGNVIAVGYGGIIYSPTESGVNANWYNAQLPAGISIFNYKYTFFNSTSGIVFALGSGLYPSGNYLPIVSYSSDNGQTWNSSYLSGIPEIYQSNYEVTGGTSTYGLNLNGTFLTVTGNVSYCIFAPNNSTSFTLYSRIPTLDTVISPGNNVLCTNFNYFVTQILFFTGNFPQSVGLYNLNNGNIIQTSIEDVNIISLV